MGVCPVPCGMSDSISAFYPLHAMTIEHVFEQLEFRLVLKILRCPCPTREDLLQGMLGRQW